ncbi:MAG TPA: hypothetical protein VF712_05920 [Thermoleophilaceae bacterium]|jgi:hypothetical protein
MGPAAGKPRRVDIGFSGGQAFSVRLDEDQFKTLREALESDRSQRWHSLDSDDSEVLIDLSQVVYIRHDTEPRGVGFSGPP